MQQPGQVLAGDAQGCITMCCSSEPREDLDLWAQRWPQVYVGYGFFPQSTHTRARGMNDSVQPPQHSCGGGYEENKLSPC